MLVYYAELYNRGSGVAARILSAAKGSGAYGNITLSTLHNTALSDRGNSSGYYTKRLNNAYNTIVSLGWEMPLLLKAAAATIHSLHSRTPRTFLRAMPVLTP